MIARSPLPSPWTLPLLAVVAACLASTSALAERRFAVIIGHNEGQVGEVPLRYAERDATRLGETLLQVGGFRPEDVLVLRGDDVATVRRALLTMNDRIRATGKDDALLMVAWSGHADSDALHLGRERLELEELETIVRGSAAAFRLLVLDACRSGAVTRVKGVTSAPSFPLDGAVSSSTSGDVAEGYVVLTAAAAGEDAQESDTLRGSFFTHHFISGLLGAADANGNEEVTLDELYRHAFKEVVRSSSATLAGTQHPTFRYDVRGKGDIVLSSFRSGTRLGTLEVPVDLDTLLFDAAGDVVAEVRAGGARRVRLPPGRYLVRVRGRDVLYDGDVEVVNGLKVLDLATLTRSAYARLVRKGEGERSLVLSPRVGVVGHTPWFKDGGVCHGGGVAVPFESRYLSVIPRLSLCAATWENDFLAATEFEGSGDVALAHVFDLPFVSLAVGASGGLTVMQQQFTTTGKAPTLTSLWPTIGVMGEVSVPLPFGLALSGGVEARTAVLTPLGSAHPATPLVLGWHTSLGWSL
jgi:hypothetical protein